MERKKEWKYFSIFNHEKEEQYLRDQHRAGWRFVKVTGFGMYHFEKTRPEEVIYQLDYNKDGSANREAYIRLFEDCGWEYIQDYVDYSYFRKPVCSMNGDEEIFCDESSRLAMLERVYKARLIPLLVIFCACLLPQFILQLKAGRYLLAAFIGGILAIYIAVFAYSAMCYYRRKNRRKQG